MPEFTGTATAEALHVLAPGAEQVVITPVWTEASGELRQRHVVCLIDDRGHALGDLRAHRAALDVLRRAYPEADWSRPQTYVSRTARLLENTPVLPLAMADAASENK